MRSSIRACCAKMSTLCCCATAGRLLSGSVGRCDANAAGEHPPFSPLPSSSLSWPPPVTSSTNPQSISSCLCGTSDSKKQYQP